MHANALSITRQCLEAISVIELGLAQVPGASQVLLRWEADKESAGEVRKWLEANVWPAYGHGLWSEPWADFMGKLAKAIQPYAHYSAKLAQWQMRVREFSRNGEQGELHAIVECGPRNYDPQKSNSNHSVSCSADFHVSTHLARNSRAVRHHFQGAGG